MKYRVIGALITAFLNVLFIDGVLIAHGASAENWFLFAIWALTLSTSFLQSISNHRIEEDSHGMGNKHFTGGLGRNLSGTTTVE